ncbi:hypothetical protein AB0O07_00570 [Streptomyces sp. NPDC093085]|uniref:hypothetical protein n=1 Tax=Streptomyces sp. NPDC093085 TaxID=3155068 RepID=UPI00341B0AEF
MGLIKDEDALKFAAAREMAAACGRQYSVVAGRRPHVWSVLDHLSSRRRPVRDLLGMLDQLLTIIDGREGRVMTFSAPADAISVPSVGRANIVRLLRLLRLLRLFRLFRLLRQYDGAPITGDSQQVLARDTICLLDVPPHKTGTALSKPVDPILGQAIDAWQAVRPDQPKFTDRRTGERVDLRFAIRARRVSTHYINNTIIPMLCRKAGVPDADVRGNITSHRARSTIASRLYNAKKDARGHPADGRRTRCRRRRASHPRPAAEAALRRPHASRADSPADRHPSAGHRAACH